jgi:hypothetical protein
MTRHRSFRVRATVLLLLVAATCGAATRSGQTVRIVGGHRWAFPVVRKMLLEFCRRREVPKGRFGMERWSDWKVTGRFRGGEGDVLVHYALTEVGGGVGDPHERFLVGQARAAVVVAARSRISGMALRQLRVLLSGQNRGADKFLARITYLGEPKWGSISGHVLRRSCMLMGRDYSGPFFAFRDDMVVCSGPGTVVRKVARNPRAVGTLLWKGDRPPGVKVIPIAEDEDGPYVKPTAKPLLFC